MANVASWASFFSLPLVPELSMYNLLDLDVVLGRKLTEHFRLVAALVFPFSHTLADILSKAYLDIGMCVVVALRICIEVDVASILCLLFLQGAKQKLLHRFIGL